ncbi:hypothetical protein [Marispirochaeta aestuarii]|uniref:hypothetical protein n=1 Tax=Marispirochaeta aestuarii TaxID=1963862 RepID=UPI0029C7FA6E|nr:hypothetical protein [Marispirochaeta aestuarii]
MNEIKENLSDRMTELGNLEAKLEVIADWLDLRSEDSEGKDLSVHMMGATTIIREVIGEINSTYNKIDRLALSIEPA